MVVTCYQGLRLHGLPAAHAARGRLRVTPGPSRPPPAKLCEAAGLLRDDAGLLERDVLQNVKCGIGVLLPEFVPLRLLEHHGHVHHHHRVRRVDEP
eukprot:CAMPEP_0180062272 /NCGR_PEP_ID=MMETSP0985-20121206/7025_1 /TAXON_ID=483367 /ORGANISM="non described non described, Strain CCMP 2436" /LENGTH=95 /DNA_ID=CAMNT_0021992427 /DNA_START=15 /DNA_END=299 /DNA_ORIENTATION=+